MARCRCAGGLWEAQCQLELKLSQARCEVGLPHARLGTANVKSSVCEWSVCVHGPGCRQPSLLALAFIRPIRAGYEVGP